jgi:ribosomal protein S19
MSRSKWKGPYVAEKSLETLKELKESYRRTQITRDSEILPQFVEKTFEVYTGKKYTEILVTEEMIGHKFGEFCATKKRFIFKKKKK